MKKTQLNDEEMVMILKRANFMVGMAYDGRIPNNALEKRIDALKASAINNKEKGLPFNINWR